MADTVIAPRYQMRYEQLINTPVLNRIPYFHDREIEYILEVSKAEQENVALRDKIERLEGPFTYSECEQSHELAKSDFKDGIDELVHCVDNANRYLARRFSIEAARGREGE